MNDDVLIEGLKLQDRTAYEHAYFAYKDVVFKTICRYIPVMEDAEELLQDVFVKAFRKIDQFNGLSQLSTWLVKIAINTSKNFLESIKKQREVINKSADIFELPDEEDECPAEEPNPADLAIQKEDRNILLNAFTKLTADQNTACKLFYMEGFQQLEIAQIMDTSLDAVESLIQRGKTKLRKILKNRQLNLSI